MNFSTESLISAVERRPELWDINNDFYKLKTNKKEAWQQVCFEIVEDFDERPRHEKLIIEKSIINKWRTVRDGYVKSLRKQQAVLKSGRAVKRSHDYLYAEQIRFLDRVLQSSSKPSEEYAEIALWENFEVSENSDDLSQTTADQPDPLIKITADPLRFRAQDPLRLDSDQQKASTNIDTMLLQQHLLSLTTHMKQHDALETDDNLLFFRSLLPAMKRLTSSQQMQFRVQMMRNLQQLLESSSSNETPHSSDD